MFGNILIYKTLFCLNANYFSLIFPPKNNTFSIDFLFLFLLK